MNDKPLSVIVFGNTAVLQQGQQIVTTDNRFKLAALLERLSKELQLQPVGKESRHETTGNT